MTGGPGLVQTAPPLVSRGASLFPPQWRAAWGPVQPLTPASAAAPTPVKTPEAASGGKMAPYSTLGRFRIGTPSSQPAPLAANAPLLTKEANNPPYWRPRIFIPRIAPLFASHTRRYSDHPLPVPAMQAYSSNLPAQRPARIGGQRVTRWPAQQVSYPTFGVGGT